MLATLQLMSSTPHSAARKKRKGRGRLTSFLLCKDYTSIPLNPKHKQFTCVFNVVKFSAVYIGRITPLAEGTRKPLGKAPSPPVYVFKTGVMQNRSTSECVEDGS